MIMPINHVIRVSSEVIDYSRFINFPDQAVKVERRGKPSIVAEFCFQDNAWYLLDLVRPHEQTSEGSITFTDMPEWLIDDAKKYIAHLWLRQRPEIIQIHKTLVAIRHLGRLLKDVDARPIDLRARHARQFSQSYSELNLSPISKQGTRRFLNRFMNFVRQQHPEVTNNDFIVQFPREEVFMEQHQPLGKPRGARVSTDLLAKIIDACAEDTKAYDEAMKDYVDIVESPREYSRQHYLKKMQGIYPKSKRLPTMRDMLSRAIKAQAVILAICVGRRAAAICNTLFEVKTSHMIWANEAGQKERGVMIRFREMKIRNIDEDVFCPDVFGELAINAIETAKKLTAELRLHNPDWKDYLFLVPGRKRKIAGVLRPSQINLYMNGNDDASGLRARYNIPGGKITTHHFRVTRATNAWLGGLQVHEVAYDLGHTSAEMAIRHYIVGNEESRNRLRFLLNHGAIRGILEDCVGGREMLAVRLGKQHVQILMKQGRILTPTRYGYCALPASSGPCPTANPCYLGPDASGGCNHHVLSPDALPALEEDREILETNISAYSSTNEYRVWVENQRNQLNVVNKYIDLVNGLQQSFRNCGSECQSCACKQ